MSVFFYVKKIYREMNVKLRITCYLMIAAMFFSALLEAFSVSSIAFFASALADPQSVINSKPIIFLQSKFGILLNVSSNYLLIIVSLFAFFSVLMRNTYSCLITNFTMNFVGSQEKYWGTRFIERLLNSSYIMYLNHKRSDLILCVSWRAYIGRVFIRFFLIAISDFLMIIVLMISLIIAQPKITLLVIFFVTLISWGIISLTKNTIMRLSNDSTEIEKMINHEASNSIHGFKDVRITGTEVYFMNRLGDFFESSKFKLTSLVMMSELPALILETFGFLILCLMVILMVYIQGVNTGVVTGSVAMLAVAAWRVLPAIARVLSSFTRLKSSLSFVSRFFNYMDYFEEEKRDLIQCDRIKIKEKIVFDKVSFSYPENPPTLKNISFELPFGSAVGIIGPSGSGKSTLIDILVGLLTPSEGRILIDDIEINRDNYRSWSSNIGYVSQTPFFYNASVASNIAFGSSIDEIDYAKIEKCKNMASINFVDKLSDGINTVIGDGGEALSGGERQRIAIARALYKEPDLLIMDEATNALDSMNEKNIMNSVYALKGQLSLIIISHTIDILNECDIIIWLEEGKIINAGFSEEIIDMYKKSKEVKN